MMLVQKQPNFTLASPPSAYTHRRHPSAPPAVVVVQPTRTPGLLSLSKPQLQRQLPQQRSPRSTPAQRSPPKIHFSAGPTPASPTPAPRGRQPKDKSAPRSDSLSARRQPHRQPSPPSQTEGQQISDPFLVSPPPTLQTRPSGKLARRRQPQPQSQTPTQPLSIPVKQQQQSKPVSRSVPLPRHRPAKRTLLPAFDFPICDDMTDAGDLSDADHTPPSPATPTRRRNHGFARQQQRPPPPPSSANRPRNHRRAPSDSGMVFHMSSDESGPENSTSDSEDLRNLLKSLSVSRKGMHTPPPAVRENLFEQQAAGYFASSVFQNSPSPEELPDLVFV
ncbi:hypothetical protein H0H81_010752 [Sphagnurus paluster]|uniref:Uncharacterized protein n=1 Tax=Sphagnurus paluster TaxID=117069 RepID=A0A9P7GJH6_9AGAR|nr:hypothetical protein H0H81_010752 [Sphagnurus paluster]